MITFYHYTDGPGKDAIVRENRIRQSNGVKDALHGPGVYGTSLHPSEGRNKIAWNNWDGFPTPGTLKKASWAIRVDLLETMVRVVPTNRDILIYTAGDLPLGVYQVIKVD